MGGRVKAERIFTWLFIHPVVFGACELFVINDFFVSTHNLTQFMPLFNYEVIKSFVSKVMSFLMAH